jgi:SAM-dependent methyltransferase
VDADAIKSRMSEVWGLGDYSLLSQTLRPAAAVLCDACAVSAGQEVLDVAAGDGNFALACAAEGASVVATDLAPGMVERGRGRALAEGYDVGWLQADAEDLPFADDRFECVGSVFGAMIAPRPEVVARELFRVARPGNTVGMTAWTSESFATELFKIMRAVLPPAPDQPRSEEWGDEDTVRRRFDGLAASLEMERRTLPLEAVSPDALAEAIAESAPPQAALRAALPAEAYTALQRDQVDLIRRWSGDGPVAIEAEYLVIVARRPG